VLVAEKAYAVANRTPHAEDAQLNVLLPSVFEQLQKLSTQVAETQQSAKWSVVERNSPSCEAS
jgi:hypothetical protein